MVRLGEGGGGGQCSTRGVRPKSSRRRRGRRGRIVRGSRAPPAPQNAARAAAAALPMKGPGVAAGGVGAGVRGGDSDRVRGQRRAQELAGRLRSRARALARSRAPRVAAPRRHHALLPWCHQAASAEVESARLSRMPSAGWPLVSCRGTVTGRRWGDSQPCLRHRP